MIEAEPDNKAHRVQKPFEELNQILGDFFTNDSLNNELTLVSGEDLCKMFDVCLFLAEQINNQREQATIAGFKIAKKCKKQEIEVKEKQ